MARRNPGPNPLAAAHVLEPPETTLLEVIDNLLTKGVLANGDLMLGVAGVDLIYLRLGALLCAADRVMPRDPAAPRINRRQSGRRGRIPR